MKHLLAREGPPRGGEVAFVLPLVIPAALIILLGAATLLSRTTSSYLAASKQSDAQAAREAAESGMNRVLSALNPFAKFSTDPYLSYLLASRWVPGSGVLYNTGISGSPEQLRSGWRLTTLDRNTVRGLLKQCGFSDRGQHANQLPPDGPKGYQDALSGAIGSKNDATGTQLRYVVTDYVPPSPVAANVAWPTECQDFTTLSGGSAQISVEGRLIRNGRLVSRYTLTRSIDVQGWPLPALPASWMDKRIFPGPPTGIRIAGAASNLNGLQLAQYLAFTTDTDKERRFMGYSYPQWRDVCSGKSYSLNLLPYNPISTSLPAMEVNVPCPDNVPANEAELPRYPFDTNLPPAGITPLQINESRANYPYLAPGSSILSPECRDSDAINSSVPGEVRPNEIDCWIESIGQPAQVGSVSYDKASNLFTISLESTSRFDVQSGSTRIKVVINNGLAKGTYVGLVTGAPVSPGVISFTPDPPPKSDPLPGSSISTYATPKSTVSPDTSASNPLSIRVNTEQKRVNLIIRGNVGTSNPDDYVSIKHLVSATKNWNYVHLITDPNDPNNVRSLWNRLRIFGLKGTTTSCPSTTTTLGGLSQTFYIKPDPATTSRGEEASLSGSFLWLPQGELVYGTAGHAYPATFLGVWWICNLNVGALSPAPPRMTFITPFHGNHDAVAAVLPGGYVSSAGVFTPDVRFPVYPSLQRIRSAF